MRRAERIVLALAALGEARQAPALAQDTGKGPRPGKYRIMSYGATGKPPLPLGSFVLGSGTYKAYLHGDKYTGEGRYTYNPATSTVSWVTGPYVGVWGGEFTVDRDGKTHKLRLKRTTIATNSTDGR